MSPGNRAGSQPYWQPQDPMMGSFPGWQINFWKYPGRQFPAFHRGMSVGFFAGSYSPSGGRREW